jgi:hypothetical protein
MKENIFRFLVPLTLIVFLSCVSTGDKSGTGKTAPRSDVRASAIEDTAFDPAQEFIGSPYEEVGHSGLFDVHSTETC